MASFKPAQLHGERERTIEWFDIRRDEWIHQPAFNGSAS